jgi:hypothetical protein
MGRDAASGLWLLKRRSLIRLEKGARRREKERDVSFSFLPDPFSDRPKTFLFTKVWGIQDF